MNTFVKQNRDQGRGEVESRCHCIWFTLWIETSMTKYFCTKLWYVVWAFHMRGQKSVPNRYMAYTSTSSYCLEDKIHAIVLSTKSISILQRVNSTHHFKIHRRYITADTKPADSATSFFFQLSNFYMTADINVSSKFSGWIWYNCGENQHDI